MTNHNYISELDNHLEVLTRKPGALSGQRPWWPPGRPTFTDPRLAAAVLDRLTFRGHIINSRTDSYRLKMTQQDINTKTRQA